VLGSGLFLDHSMAFSIVPLPPQCLLPTSHPTTKNTVRFTGGITKGSAVGPTGLAFCQGWSRGTHILALSPTVLWPSPWPSLCH
jgi:hypothetical protein